jgi:hypothetical protein
MLDKPVLFMTTFDDCHFFVDVFVDFSVLVTYHEMGGAVNVTLSKFLSAPSFHSALSERNMNDNA